MNDEIIISIVICTYNRSQLLRGAIESLLNQTLNRSEYEIIVVDNVSADDTKKLVNKYITDFKEYNIKYIFESKQGLSHARNAGFKKSSAEYVAYIDDDAKADKNWLLEISHVIDEIKPDIFGGPIYPFYEKEKPKWFLDKYEIRTNGNEARFLEEHEYISGSNIIFKKEILELLGGFDANIGMSGNKLSYGEETKLIVEARKRIENIKVFYSPQMIVYHLVPANKMKILYFIKSRLSSGKSCVNIWNEKVTNETKMIHVRIFFKTVIYIFFHILKGTLLRDKKKYKYFQNYFIEKIAPHLFNIGYSCKVIIS